MNKKRYKKKKSTTSKLFVVMMCFVLLFGSIIPAGAYETEAETPKETDLITITFRVDDSDYTQDPGSGETHLASEAAIEGGDLTYTSWAGRYKVTGTGVVCSYTIPVGTSLSQNGYSIPNLTVENIGNSNTYSYVSGHSWVTEKKTVSSADTIFVENTTLHLSLYKDSEYYNLDFVCCEEDNSSISYYMNKSVTFKLGESVSAEYIPDYDLVTTKFKSSVHDVNTFEGWQLKETDTGKLVDFSAGMPITEEYTDTANYGNAVKVYAVWESSTEDAYYDVIFHDIQPDGTESDITVDLSVQEGLSLSEAIEQADGELEDGTLLSDCIWYTVGEDETKTVVDPDTTEVTGNMELYTYSYQMILMMQSQIPGTYALSRSLVDVETVADGTITMIITAREGEPLSTSDFVIGEVDYSTYVWTYEDSNGDSHVLDIQSLIENGVTENITAVSDGSLVMPGMTAVPGHKINFYIFIDEQRVLLESRTLTSYTKEGDSINRNYLSAATLESIYGEYGFEASQLSADTRYFPHTKSEANSSGTIWTDAPVVEVDGRYYSPITTNKADADVYYLPKQTLGVGSGSWTNYQKTETFYSVKVRDLGNKVYTAATLPETTYTPTGGEVSMTVLNADGVKWRCVGKDGITTVNGTDGKGTTTFTINNISQPYVISTALAEGEKQISYDIKLTVTPSDSEYDTPTIEGGSTYDTIASGDAYTLLAPSRTSYFYKSGKYLGEATFTGWAVNGDTNNLVKPGNSLDLTQYDAEIVTLTAQWTTKLGGTSNKTGSMVNFFVSLGAMPEGTTDWTGSTSDAEFTDSVYTVDCGVKASAAVEQNLYQKEVTTPYSTQYFVLGDTSGSDLNDYHTTITSKLSEGYTLQGKDGENHTYHATFPTDEVVLQNIRKMVSNGTNITINGHEIAVDELTTENFTIKWYVFKYDTTDGWHIDGILVSKTGEMLVTKTFAGDTDSINEVKNNGYSINVVGGSAHTGGTLSLNDASHDASTNTYTWAVPVDQYYDYAVSENNYILDASLTTTTAQYNISNSKNSTLNTGGWVNYSQAVTVTGQGYREEDTNRLTVAFLNTYTAPGTLILQKVDAVTGKRMSGVSFNIAKSDGTAFTMRDMGNSHYSADSSHSGNETTTITTDYSGQAYLWIGGGSYTLEEHVPTGYDDPGVIKVNLQGDEDNQYKVIAINSVSAANGEKFVGKDDQLELVVKNYSRTIDLSIEKIWADEDKKPVTIQLYRNGKALGSDYTVKLDGTIDSVEKTAWKCKVTGLPLYANGDLAQYSIREEGLGDFKYTQEYSDGYRYYDVTYSDMSYLDENGAVTTDMADVSIVVLSVTNRRSTGTLSINKVDQDGNALSGAEFWLYEVPADSEEATPSYSVSHDKDGHNVLENASYIQSATSDENGRVSFGNMSAGRYYLVEHAAPVGYENSNKLYMLVMTDDGTLMYCWEDSKWNQITGLSVSNTAQTEEVTITKQVTGNMGDRDKYFEFTVNCTEAMIEGTGYTLSEDGKTATFNLKDDGSITLQGVRKGATLIISEVNAGGYTTTIKVGDQPIANKNYTLPVNSNNKVLITVINDKDWIVDTGVLLDSLPYILILVVVILGAVLFLKNRKRRNDD